MGIIAWIVLGLVSGVVAKALMGSKARYGVLVTTLIGIGGALLGGWVATKYFAVDTSKGFFDISTWITAILGSVVLILAFHALSGSGSGRRSGLRRARR